MTGPLPVPAMVGIGLKPVHVDALLGEESPVAWCEVHAENYMGPGGRPHRDLEAIRVAYPLSLHGVGLSIGGEEPLDTAHLARLRDLERRYRPGLVSEHLAWSSHGGLYFNDLLPLPYTAETLRRCAAHVNQVQQVLGRQILLENPSTYVAFAESTLDEVDFLSEIVRRTGCGLLLDVNNVHVSATNHAYPAEAYIDAFPVDHVGEIHLAGHATDIDDAGAPLLIDSHDRPVAEKVWMLFRRALRRTGALPTLIEWDNDLPDWIDLLTEADKARCILEAIPVEEPQHAAE